MPFLALGVSFFGRIIGWWGFWGPECFSAGIILNGIFSINIGSVPLIQTTSTLVAGSLKKE